MRAYINIIREAVQDIAAKRARLDFLKHELAKHEMSTAQRRKYSADQITAMKAERDALAFAVTHERMGPAMNQEPEQPLPDIALKKIGKSMIFIFINGEKAGVVHLASHDVASGFSKWRKQRYWSGEMTFAGKTIDIGPTEKISEVLPKITRLIRGALINRQPTILKPSLGS